MRLAPLHQRRHARLRCAIYLRARALKASPSERARPERPADEEASGVESEARELRRTTTDASRHESECFLAPQEARSSRRKSSSSSRMPEVIEESSEAAPRPKKRPASRAGDTTTRRSLVALCHALLWLAALAGPTRAELVRFPQAPGEPSFAATRAPHAPKYAASEPRSMRVNELDVFLDDINQSELRAIAQGQPIGAELFRPKLLAAQSEPRHKHEPSDKEEKEEKEVDPSGSEQQVYSQCALILQRTYVKNINDPKHQLVPFGKTEQACISYKHIDKALELAKRQLKFKQLKRKRKKQQKAPIELLHETLEPPEDLVAALGELNMATTQILATQFDLSNDELLNGLPLIDMSKTNFWPLCPLLVRQDLECKLTRFRTQTGHCNNLKHPTWGAAMTPFARYLPPVHPDGIWQPRKSIVTEVTFELGEGHRETHSNLSPTMRVPVFDTHHEHTHHHAHLHHLHHASTRMERAGARPRDPSGAPADEPAESAEEAADSDEADERAASSVQFLSHAPPLGQEAADPMRPPEFSAPSLMEAHHQHQQQRLHVAATQHYQQSSSPARPFAASATPIAMGTPPLELGQLTAAASGARHKTAATRSLAHELPSARLVTSVVHRDVELPSHDLSILFMSWGQLLDHDMTRAAQSPSSIKCCGQEEPKHKLCLPIKVPAADPFYGQFGVRCLEFRRTLAGLRPNCVLGPRVHQNAITAPIDANFVYGSSQAQAEALRLFKGGQLRSRDWFKEERLKPLLPAQELEPDLECIARPKDLFCFLAGDVRANEQTHLTVLHTLYMREHNRMAERLAELNPHWDDERLYQETRHIQAAGVQHVMISEYLPLLIGRKMAQLYNLTSSSADGHQGAPLAGAFWHGYDPSVTTSVSNSFAAAAFRQGHTFVQGQVERYNKFHELVASEKLRNLFKQPFLIYQPGVLDELTAGMVNQPSQSYDPFISEDISGHLFQAPEAQFGHDLPAINLQRGREQGLPGYNLFREWCGLPRAETFDQLEPYLTNHTAALYARLYKHVDDIDLWSGGVSERKLPGAAIGPTFACIIARQFSNTRRGDRFWYENPGLPSSFTPEQLAEVRKINLAKILCANSDDLPTIQRWALRMAHPVLNPRLACHQLPEPDLRFWQEE